MNQYIPDDSALKVFSRPIALKYQALPLKTTGRNLLSVFAHPPSPNELSDLIFYTGLAIQVELAEPNLVQKLIDLYYPERTALDATPGENAQFEHHSESLQPDLGQGRIVDRVNAIISQAASMEASDIHLEPTESGLVVRYRIDGVLQENQFVPRDDQAPVISRIKLMSGMDIAEKRRPQDGRITMRGLGEFLDIRVSSVPTRGNEKLVLRLLNKSGKLKDLNQLGMTESDLASFKRYIEKPQGMILVTGPTGSGKSTTLYAALSHLTIPGVNIMTIEDPIEYEVNGIIQSQVKPEIKYDFSTALRAFLRQDPDIIMIGEIRDLETAQIALRAAMTGHLVLSSVHNNDSASTITRLVDIGVESYLVASSLSLVVAQRLVRKYCPVCKGQSSSVPAAASIESGKKIDDATKSKSSSCLHCNSTGYRGRVGLFEVLEINDDIREAIQNRCPAHVIESMARDRGVLSLASKANQLVAENITSNEEIRRVLS